MRWNAAIRKTLISFSFAFSRIPMQEQNNFLLNESFQKPKCLAKLSKQISKDSKDDYDMLKIL